MTALKQHIETVLNKADLSEKDAANAFEAIMSGEANPLHVAAFLVALRMKGETIEEITGAIKTLRVKCKGIQAPKGAIDTCGTGGDKSGSLNISTATAFVVSACGVPVAKHGNKAISSKSGSADVLSELSININAEPEIMEKALQEIGICFLMAPKYHTAMKHVAPIRAELGIRTIFNILGPLLNPANTQHQLIGVYDKKWLEPLAKTLIKLGSEKAWIVHGSDGMDEITINGTTHVAQIDKGEYSSFTIEPAEYGIKPDENNALLGQDAKHNAKALRELLSEGNNQAYKDIVVLNSAACLVVANKANDLKEGINHAESCLSSGKALEKLEQLISFSNS